RYNSTILNRENAVFKLVQELQKTTFFYKSTSVERGLCVAPVKKMNMKRSTIRREDLDLSTAFNCFWSSLTEYPTNNKVKKIQKHLHKIQGPIHDRYFADNNEAVKLI
ncbi:hypothetical protein L9F63_024012, partial [Diploptera punctata]